MAGSFFSVLVAKKDKDLTALAIFHENSYDNVRFSIENVPLNLLQLIVQVYYSTLMYNYVGNACVTHKKSALETTVYMCRNIQINSCANIVLCIFVGFIRSRNLGDLRFSRVFIKKSSEVQFFDFMLPLSLYVKQNCINNNVGVIS